MGAMPATTDTVAILAGNLRRLMDASSALRTQQAVAKATRGVVNQTTVGRILSRKHNPTASTVAALARAFDLSPWQLLVPDIDPANPPTLRTAEGAEAEFYRRMQALAAELGINGKK